MEKNNMKKLLVLTASLMMALAMVSCTTGSDGDDDTYYTEPDGNGDDNGNANQQNASGNSGNTVTKYTCENCGTEYTTEAEKDACAVQDGCPGYVAPAATTYKCENCKTEYDTQEEANNCSVKEGCPNYKYKCAECDKTYDTQDKATACTHYVCETCGETYYSASDAGACATNDAALIAAIDDAYDLIYNTTAFSNGTDYTIKTCMSDLYRVKLENSSKVVSFDMACAKSLSKKALFTSSVKTLCETTMPALLSAYNANNVKTLKGTTCGKTTEEVITDFNTLYLTPYYADTDALSTTDTDKTNDIYTLGDGSLYSHSIIYIVDNGNSSNNRFVLNNNYAVENLCE